MFNICLGITNFFPQRQCANIYICHAMEYTGWKILEYSVKYFENMSCLSSYFKAERIFEVDHKLKCPRNLLSIRPYVHSCNKEAFGVYMPQSNRWLFNGIYIHSNKIRLVKDNATCCNVNGTDGRIKCLWKQGSRSIKS